MAREKEQSSVRLCNLRFCVIAAETGVLYCGCSGSHSHFDSGLDCGGCLTSQSVQTSGFRLQFVSIQRQDHQCQRFPDGLAILFGKYCDDLLIEQWQSRARSYQNAQTHSNGNGLQNHSSAATKARFAE